MSQKQSGCKKCVCEYCQEDMHEQKLIQLLKKKRGFFETILDLSEVESELSVDEWINSLKQKQLLLSCVEEIDEEIRSFKARLHDLSHDVVEELDHIRGVVKRILHFDELNQEKRKRDISS